MRNILLIILIGMAAQSMWAQSEKQEKLPVRNELYAQGGLHTRGFQVGITYAIIRNWRRTMAFQIGFGGQKDAKERKQNFETLSITGGTSKSFIYGKRNSFYYFKLGYGEKYYFSDKRNRKALSLALCYGGGISVGMIKPYYLDLIYRTDGGSTKIRSEAFSENNVDKFLSPQLVDGESGAAYGWNEITPILGGYAKVSLLLDWGAMDEIVKAVEVGINTDFYFRKIPIMILHDHAPVFFNIFVNVHLGKRW
ncbi:MAG: hypothetical protein GY810_13575 [Aureispira sp.]|nr:hypothetical protein [Aureispira sp.]